MVARDCRAPETIPSSHLHPPPWAPHPPSTRFLWHPIPLALNPSSTRSLWHPIPPASVPSVPSPFDAPPPLYRIALALPLHRIDSRHCVPQLEVLLHRHSFSLFGSFPSILTTVPRHRYLNTRCSVAMTKGSRSPHSISYPILADRFSLRFSPQRYSFLGLLLALW